MPYKDVDNVSCSLLGDGYEMLDNRCTACIAYELECTYYESSKVWVPLFLLVSFRHINNYYT